MTPATPLSMTPFATTFAKAYYAAQNPRKLPLFNGRPGAPDAQMLTQAEVNNLTTQLIAQGVTIDEQIDWQGWDPLTTMAMRLLYDILWVPPGLGNVMGTIVVITPGEFAGPMPPGAIKTSVTLADYPPFPESTNPVPAATASVGPQYVGPYYEIFGPIPPVGAKDHSGRFTVVSMIRTDMFGDGSTAYYWKLG